MTSLNLKPIILQKENDPSLIAYSLAVTMGGHMWLGASLCFKDYDEDDGIASIILKKFARSGDRIILSISKPLLLSNLRNSFSVLILLVYL
jgi:hypothetical protein